MGVIPISRVDFSTDDLNPKMRAPILAMITAARAHKFNTNGLPSYFAPFEGYRPPIRQMHLFTVEKTTKARPWESAHQYGLAVDFAVRIMHPDADRESWSWPVHAPWPELKRIAKSFGLDIPIEWDRGHVEHGLWASFQKILKR